MRKIGSRVSLNQLLNFFFFWIVYPLKRDLMFYLIMLNNNNNDVKTDCAFCVLTADFLNLSATSFPSHRQRSPGQGEKVRLSEVKAKSL